MAFKFDQDSISKMKAMMPNVKWEDMCKSAPLKIPSLPTTASSQMSQFMESLPKKTCDICGAQTHCVQTGAEMKHFADSTLNNTEWKDCPEIGQLTTKCFSQAKEKWAILEDDKSYCMACSVQITCGKPNDDQENLVETMDQE